MLVAMETGQFITFITVLHTFYPSAREDYKLGGNSSEHSIILRLLEAGPPFWSEVKVGVSEWSLCFSGLQVELQF